MLNRREGRSKRNAEKGRRKGAPSGRNGGGREDRTAWQSQLVSPNQRLAFLLLSPNLSDLTITFPGSQRQLKAHRLVLAMSSPVFEKLFYGEMCEGERGEGGEHTHYTCPDPPDAFLWLLEHLYTGITHLPGLPLVLGLAPLALKYQLPALSALCSRHLEERVKAETVLTIYNTAILLQDARLLDRCTQVVREEAGRVLEGEEVGKLTRRSLLHLLRHPPPVSQVLLFRCLLFWAQAQVSSHPTYDTSPTSSCPFSLLRQEILEFLPLIRFLEMTASEYVSVVMPSGVFTTEEDLAVLLNIQGRPVPLPPSCSALTTHRQ